MQNAAAWIKHSLVEPADKNDEAVVRGLAIAARYTRPYVRVIIRKEWAEIFVAEMSRDAATAGQEEQVWGLWSPSPDRVYTRAKAIGLAIGEPANLDVMIFTGN